MAVGDPNGAPRPPHPPYDGHTAIPFAGATIFYVLRYQSTALSCPGRPSGFYFHIEVARVCEPVHTCQFPPSTDTSSQANKCL